MLWKYKLKTSIVPTALLLVIMGSVQLIQAGVAEARPLEERCEEYKDRAGPNIERLDLNRADEEELQTLPGIGVKTARAIINHRKAIGGFKSYDQLRRVRGVGEKIYDCLKALTIVGERPDDKTPPKK